MCELPQGPETLSTIRDGSAHCDARTDDGPAIQSLLDTINGPQIEGVLYLPPCAHFIDRTLLVGDNVTIVGHGPRSALVRGNTHTWRPYWDPALCSGPNATGQFDDWGFIANTRYNCENANITLQDFALDGRLVIGKSSSTGINSVAIAWSGVRDSRIERLLIHEVAQDAIFLRNGGVNVRVQDNVIDGFSMKWYNAAGINIEMHPTGTNFGYPTISGNHIIVRAPLPESGSQVTGINLNRVGATASPPGGTIVGNLIEVGDGHGSIDLPNGAVQTLVADNTVLPLWRHSRVGYRGPVLVGDIDVRGNVIYGGNRPVPYRALNLVSPGTANSVTDNVVVNWAIDSESGTNAYGVVAIKGHRGFEVRRNRIEQVTGEVGLRIGFTPGQGGPFTQDGIITGNIVHNTDNSGWVSCHPSFACDLTVGRNRFDGISSWCSTLCP